MVIMKWYRNPGVISDDCVTSPSIYFPVFDFLRNFLKIKKKIFRKDKSVKLLVMSSFMILPRIQKYFDQKAR